MKDALSFKVLRNINLKENVNNPLKLMGQLQALRTSIDCISIFCEQISR